MKEQEEGEAKKQVIKITRYTVKGLAVIYGVHRNTFTNWIKPLASILGKRQGYYYSIEQVKTIFTYLQLPSYLVVEVETEDGLYKKIQPRKE